MKVSHGGSAILPSGGTQESRELCQETSVDEGFDKVVGTSFRAPVASRCIAQRGSCLVLCVFLDSSLHARKEIMVDQDAPMTISTNARKRLWWRFAWATLFATSLVVCLVPAGCAATDEVAETPPQPSVQPEPAERYLTPSVIQSIKACAKERASRLLRHSYELTFDIDATNKGVIRSIDAKGNRLDDADMEVCMIRALQDLPVRDFIENGESLPETSKNVLSSSRSLIGSAAVLPTVIRLAPIVIAAPGGITIVVGVVIIVAVAAVVVESTRKPTKEECEEEKTLVIKECLELLAMRDPPLEIVGRKPNMAECIVNSLTEDCGGKKVDWGKKGQGQPGRRW